MLWLIQHQLKSKNAATRREAVERLCQTPNRRAFQLLCEALSDADASVRRLAVVALGKLEDERCLEPIWRVQLQAIDQVLSEAICECSAGQQPCP